MFIFPCVQNGADARVTMRRFDNAAFRAYAHVTLHHEITFATVCVLRDDVKFCDGPGILHAKSRIHVLTARELPC